MQHVMHWHHNNAQLSTVSAAAMTLAGLIDFVSLQIWDHHLLHVVFLPCSPSVFGLSITSVPSFLLTKHFLHSVSEP